MVLASRRRWQRTRAVCLMLMSGLLGAQSQQPAKQAAPIALPPVVPAPGPGMLVVSCDSGGCWDEFGVRYDRAGGGAFVRADGKSCLMIKNRMHCE